MDCVHWCRYFTYTMRRYWIWKQIIQQLEDTNCNCYNKCLSVLQGKSHTLYNEHEFNQLVILWTATTEMVVQLWQAIRDKNYGEDII